MQSDDIPSSSKHAHVCGACVKSQPTRYSGYINLFRKQCDSTHPQTGVRCISRSPMFGPPVQSDGAPSSGTRHAHVCGTCAKTQPVRYSGYIDLVNKRQCDATHPKTGLRCTSRSPKFGPATRSDGTPGSSKDAHVCGACIKAQPVRYSGYTDLGHKKCNSCNVQHSEGPIYNHMCRRCYYAWCMKNKEHDSSRARSFCAKKECV